MINTDTFLSELSALLKRLDDDVDPRELLDELQAELEYSVARFHGETKETT